MNDPYQPAERVRGLTRGALEIVAACRFPVHVITKGDLVTRDADLLCEIRDACGPRGAVVSFTITTPDDDLARKLEPGAAPSSARFAALEALASLGLWAGVTLMPVLPFIEDDEESIRRLVSRAAECGAKYVIPAWGMTLRNRQRAYYYEQLDRLFPGRGRSTSGHTGRGIRPVRPTQAGWGVSSRSWLHGTGSSGLSRRTSRRNPNSSACSKPSAG